MKTKSSIPTLAIACTYFPLIFMVVCGATVQNLEAVEPDAVLYSEQTGERDAAYKMRAQQLAKKIAAAVEDKEKNDLQVQQQLLIKLEEFPDKPEKPSMDLGSLKLVARKSLSWQEAEHYLDRYIKVIRENKISIRNLKSSDEQIQTLYNQLVALADNSPDQNVLQLQYAIQVRQFNHQSEIVKRLKQGLAKAKEQYPAVLERIHLDQKMVYEHNEILNQAKERLQRLENEKNQAAADDVLIQEQESVLAGYLGRELTDNQKKVMHYEQLTLLKLQTRQLFEDIGILEGKAGLLEEEQKAAWYRVLGKNPDFFKLADSSGDISKQISLLKSKTNKLHIVLYTSEKELSTLRGGNAIIGPKAQELLTILDTKVRTISTRLSALDRQAEMLENKGQLLDRAIDLKQTSLGSMVTRTREATDDIFEKIMSVLKYPLVSYSGMNLSLFLFVQLFTLLVFGIIINRLYGHMVLRTGTKRKWSEQTIHLVQAVGKYPFILIIAMITLSVVGINTRSLALVAGALSVGIGFGMQTIVSNLVSGIILLFDKSIRPGDFISLGENSRTGGFRGNVVQMNIRATVLRTNDNINIIIPNADLMASKVVNWTYSDDKIRFRIPFSVAYGTDVERVKALIQDAVLGLPAVLAQPEPQIWMTEHADSSLAFVAAIWVKGQSARQPAQTTDTVLTIIYKTLNEHGIEIPLPQMDLRMRDPDHQSSGIVGIPGTTDHKMFQGTVPQ